MYRLYRLLSPIFKEILHHLGLSTGRCRYYPTCSDYSRQAFKNYGFFRGIWVSGKRLLKCHPWSRGGYDPVP